MASAIGGLLLIPIKQQCFNKNSGTNLANSMQSINEHGIICLSVKPWQGGDRE